VQGDFHSNVYIHAWHRQMFFVGTLGENSKQVVFIATFSEAYKTANGFSLATPPERVEALLGKPTATTPFGGADAGTRMIYDETGFVRPHL